MVVLSYLYGIKPAFNGTCTGCLPLPFSRSSDWSLVISSWHPYLVNSDYSNFYGPVEMWPLHVSSCWNSFSVFYFIFDCSLVTKPIFKKLFKNTNKKLCSQEHTVSNTEDSYSGGNKRVHEKIYCTFKHHFKLMCATHVFISMMQWVDMLQGVGNCGNIMQHLGKQDLSLDISGIISTDFTNYIMTIRCQCLAN